MRSDTLSTISTAILATCAVIVTGMLARREFFPAPPSRSTKPVAIANWKEFRGGQPIGEAGKKVSLVIFSDYQCPACRSLAARLDSLRSQFPVQLSIYYRNVPVPAHKFARPAAFAAECAARNGRFEQAHRLLFAEPDSLATRSWGSFASKLGMADSAAFSACVRDSLPAAVVQRDETDAHRLNVRVTPTLLLNEQLLEGVPTDLAERIGKLAR